MVSWRWIIDNRGDRVQVDWPKLIVVLVATAVACRVAFWLLPGASVYVVLLPLAAAGIAFDISARRRSDR